MLSLPKTNQLDKCLFSNAGCFFAGKGSNHQRRVSFSEEDTAYEVEATSAAAAGGARPHHPGRMTASSRQMTVPLTGSSNMTYLTVPGQTGAVVTVPAVAPQLSPEAKRAQTSAQARKRRATRLMKVGSFCSITSEGDGDIFQVQGLFLATRTIPLDKSRAAASAICACFVFLLFALGKVA